jgi:kumamolisin
MAADRKMIPGSERTAPDAPALGPPDPSQSVEVSIYLKRPEAAVRSQTSGPAITRSALREARQSALKEPMARVAAFATGAGLTVTEQDPARRLVKVRGTAATMEAAFGAKLSMHQSAAGPFRARAGALTAPADVVAVIEAVLGLDQRPVATPKLVRLAKPHATSGHLPNAITALYGFPKTTGSGKGQTIAIIELGGGVSSADTAVAFAAMKLPPPKVVAVGVDGALNQPGKDTNADGEVALDVQVAGAGAPGATLAIYFAPNTDQGFVDAITQAAHDQTNAPSVMSISWGAAESAWTAQAITSMSSAFQDAADLGLCVFAASGDNLATDGQSDGAAHVDFPSSSPLVVGCGGTKLPSKAGSVAGESVWNSGGSGTGGGISSQFPVPAYQQGLTLPSSAAGKPGRGVPDIAGDADPNTGYRVQVDGKAEIIGGTSAVAPLWAGLFALVGETAGKLVGPPHAVLYGHPAAFNDVTKGNNRSGKIGFAAAKGWDACTGLGTPRGAAIAALFK